MLDLAFARALHILAVVHWIGGVFMVTALILPAVARLDDARSKLESWRRDYNDVRPHSAIGYKTPTTLMNHAAETYPL